MFKSLLSAAAMAAALVTSADASTLRGIFDIDIYHRTNVNRAQSHAAPENLTGYVDTIRYNGDLSFATRAGSRSTIGSWLATGNGTVTGLDASTARLKLSKGNIRRGTATTTYFDIRGVFREGFNSMIRHDDGIRLFDDGVVVVSDSNPQRVDNTAARGFDGGLWRLIYVATNSDPSILRVTGKDLPTAAPVPVPASLPLLLAGLGGIALLRRKSR